MPDDVDITGLLQKASDGDPEAMARAVSVAYDQLRAIAHRHLAWERADHTLDTAGVVHETYLKLVGLNRIRWQNREQFYAIAARAMRQILTDYARARRAEKRGGGVEAVEFDDGLLVLDDRADDLIALDLALQELERIDARHARIVECRFFGGLSVEETAETLGISPSTVKRGWALARAWLNRELSEGGSST